MNKKKFYESHKNFSHRSLLDYYISPGIRCKFDILKNKISNNTKFNNGIDLGSSGNSFLLFMTNLHHKSFFDLANFPLRLYKSKTFYYPVCGDLTYLPYRANSFDFVSALDVLEHIKNDKIAISEMSRILKPGGLAIITVPHRMKFYSNQDRLIGHFRRYEITRIVDIMRKYDLKRINTFGVYGRLMKISDIQSADPEKVEESLLKLRSRYHSNLFFRAVWEIFVRISSKIMKFDANNCPIGKIMNIGFIFKKELPD
ncbi:MAG: class I SAM-dependent methyltransferase [Candidatus Hermodarchaeota archaeon]